MTSGRFGDEWAEATRRVYERVAAGWDRGRDRSLFEKAWLDRLLAATPPGAPILDLGCGGGEPVAAYLIAAGRPVVGVDFARPMLALARRRFPAAEWVEADMRDLDLGRRFGGVVSWGGFLHLSGDEQRAALPRIAAHIDEGGALLLTVGPGEGETEGRVEGEPVPHASLAPDEYAAILDAAGMAVEAFVPNDPDCRGHSLLLAVRPPATKKETP